MYIEEAPRPVVFQLSHLAKMYWSSLEHLGGHVPDDINSTRLRTVPTQYEGILRDPWLYGKRRSQYGLLESENKIGGNNAFFRVN